MAPGAPRKIVALALSWCAALTAACKEPQEMPPAAGEAAGAPKPLEAKVDAAEGRADRDAAAQAQEPALFVEGYDAFNGITRFAQVSASEGRMRQHRSVMVLGSITAPDGKELAARSGSDLLVAVGPAPRVRARRLVRPYARGARDVALGDFQATSLGYFGARALVGGPGQIALVDFSSPAPRLDLLVRQPHPGTGKAYEAFAAQGDRLVALDGGSAPFFADLFRLRGDGMPELEKHLALPALEGRYVGAALLGAELLLRADYDSAKERGRSLRRVALASLAGGGARAEGGPGEDFEEVGEWEEAQEPDAGAGSSRSGWRGLAVVGSMVVACAGERGAIVLPRAFNERSKALFVDVDGLCLDSVPSGGKAFALVRTAKGMRIVCLADGQEGLGVESTLALMGRWSGLVP